MRRRLVLGIITALILVAGAAAALFIVFPAGADTAEGAVLDHIDERADANSARVLADREWGEGRLVLAGYARSGERRLGVAFATEGRRGWHVGAYTDRLVQPTDVVIGSLVVARSEGGKGQPAWSAAAGELGDPRIEKVEIRWASGDTSSADRTNDAYLVVQRGSTTALDARYVTDDGTEIAKVPIEEPES